MKRLDEHTGFVYTAIMMKNITLSADESLIEQARKRAVVEHTTLNSLFRAWLARYASQPILEWLNATHHRAKHSSAQHSLLQRQRSMLIPLLNGCGVTRECEG